MDMDCFFLWEIIKIGLKSRFSIKIIGLPIKLIIYLNLKKKPRIQKNCLHFQ